MHTAAAINIGQYFENLEDPRVSTRTDHDLVDIIVITLVATIGGSDTFEKIADFGVAKRRLFARFLKLRNGIPSHDTFNRVFGLLDPIAFQQCFFDFIGDLFEAVDPTGPKTIAIDGKTLCGSGSQAQGIKMLHLVSAWATEHGITLGQIAVDDKSNEITAIPELLDVIDVAGALVTIDAMGCQKAIAEKIVDQEGDYILQVKDNQPTLHQQMQNSYEEFMTREEGFKDTDSVDYDYAQAFSKGHGREEERECFVLSLPETIVTNDEWPSAKAMVVVIRHRTIDGHRTTAFSYYLASLWASAEEFMKWIRGHWGIENELHWVLDVTFREDENHLRDKNAQNNLAFLRRLVITLLRQKKAKYDSYNRMRYRAACNEAYLIELLELFCPKNNPKLQI